MAASGAMIAIDAKVYAPLMKPVSDLIVPSPIIPPPPRGEGPHEVVALMMYAALRSRAEANQGIGILPARTSTTPGPEQLSGFVHKTAAEIVWNCTNIASIPATPRNGT